MTTWQDNWSDWGYSQEESEAWNHDMARRNQRACSGCECERQRRCNGLGYQILGTEHGDAIAGSFDRWPCGCTCNAAHLATNEYWEKIHHYVPELFIPAQDERRPSPPQPRGPPPIGQPYPKTVIYYKDEQRKANELMETHGMLQGQLRKAEKDANCGAERSIKSLHVLQGQIADTKARIEHHEANEKKGRQKANREAGSSDWSYRAAAGEGRQLLSKGSTPKKDGKRRSYPV